jgi:hypothetical protein
MKTVARILKNVLLRLLSPFRKLKEPENDASMTVNEIVARFKVYQISDWTPKKKSRPQRARRALVPTPPEAVPPRAVPRETAAKAIHLLDARFPWLRGAEKKLYPNQAWRAPVAPRPQRQPIDQVN